MELEGALNGLFASCLRRLLYMVDINLHNEKKDIEQIINHFYHVLIVHGCMELTTSRTCSFQVHHDVSPPNQALTEKPKASTRRMSAGSFSTFSGMQDCLGLIGYMHDFLYLWNLPSNQMFGGFLEANHAKQGTYL